MSNPSPRVMNRKQKRTFRSSRAKKARCVILVDMFWPTVPANCDLNQRATYLLTEIEKYCREELGIVFDTMEDEHIDDLVALGDLTQRDRLKELVHGYTDRVRDREFRDGQKRKVTAGNVYQEIILRALRAEGLSVEKPTKKKDGSSVDIVQYRGNDHWTPISCFGIKHTLRERSAQELRYQRAAQVQNAPFFMITNDAPSQTHVDRMIHEWGYNVVVPDDVFADLLANPHLKPLSQLPALLRSRELPIAA